MMTPRFGGPELFEERDVERLQPGLARGRARETLDSGHGRRKIVLRALGAKDAPTEEDVLGSSTSGAVPSRLRRRCCPPNGPPARRLSPRSSAAKARSPLLLVPGESGPAPPPSRQVRRPPARRGRSARPR